VLFESNSSTDPLIKQFTEWNFGGYSNPVYVETRALEGLNTARFSVTDAASLVAPLTELSSFKSFTYPIQLCSIPKEALPPVGHDRFGEVFHVIIGNTLADIAYFWNRPASIPQWTRTFLKQVWLPLGVATDPQLTHALSLWLQRSADPNGSCKGSIRFVSLSLTQEQLQEVVEPFTTKLRVFRDVTALREVHPPKFSEWIRPHGHETMDLYRATGTEERVTLQEPDVAPGYHLGEHWMADMYVEFRPERYPTVSGRPLWWQLARLNGLVVHMFKHQARVLHTRYPSVLMKVGEARLDINLPDDISVFNMLASLPNRSYYMQMDPRSKRRVHLGFRTTTPNDRRRVGTFRAYSSFLEAFILRLIFLNRVIGDGCSISCPDEPPTRTLSAFRRLAILSGNVSVGIVAHSTRTKGP
jgi:hypothetical protein